MEQIMAREKLTAGKIEKIKPPDQGQKLYWDSAVRGLGIRATPSAKVYIFQSRLNGKSIRVKIGDVSTWLLDSNLPDKPGARQEARRLQSLIDKGVDPRLDKQNRLQEQVDAQLEVTRQEITLAEVWPIYIEDRRPHWSQRHYYDHLHLSHLGGKKKKRGRGKTVPGALASLMPYRLVDITPKAIESWAKKGAIKRPAQTRLAFALLRAFANWCEEQDAYRGLCNLSAFSGRIKKQTIPKAEARNDSLQKEQLPAWFAAVSKCPNKIIAAYLQTLLLTGARREEILNLTWSDVDFTWKSMVIRDKVDGTRTIPLTPHVADLLIRLPQRNNWVFSSPRSESGRLQEPRKAHTQVLEEAGIEGLTIHGLRRSFSNLSEWVEVPTGIVYQIMGHKPSATAERHYKKRPLDLLRKWHVRIEGWILEQVGIKQPRENEVKIKAAKRET